MNFLQVMLLIQATRSFRSEPCLSVTLIRRRRGILTHSLNSFSPGIVSALSPVAALAAAGAAAGVAPGRLTPAGPAATTGGVAGRGLRRRGLSLAAGRVGAVLEVRRALGADFSRTVGLVLALALGSRFGRTLGCPKLKVAMRSVAVETNVLVSSFI